MRAPSMHVAIEQIVVPGGPLTLTCTAEPLSCTPVLPAGLQALLDGQPLNWALLLQILPQLLTKLETELDGAAQDVHIPLIGDTLDAGANIVGTFNDEVVTPFAALVAQITAAADSDGDSVIEPVGCGEERPVVHLRRRRRLRRSRARRGGSAPGPERRAAASRSTTSSSPRSAPTPTLHARQGTS